MGWGVNKWNTSFLSSTETPVPPKVDFEISMIAAKQLANLCFRNAISCDFF